jgi:hypothetical protein
LNLELRELRESFSFSALDGEKVAKPDEVCVDMV